MYILPFYIFKHNWKRPVLRVGVLLIRKKTELICYKTLFSQLIVQINIYHETYPQRCWQQPIQLRPSNCYIHYTVYTYNIHGKWERCRRNSLTIRFGRECKLISLAARQSPVLSSDFEYQILRTNTTTNSLRGASRILIEN